MVDDELGCSGAVTYFALGLQTTGVACQPQALFVYYLPIYDPGPQNKTSEAASGASEVIWPPPARNAAG